MTDVVPDTGRTAEAEWGKPGNTAAAEARRAADNDPTDCSDAGRDDDGGSGGSEGGDTGGKNTEEARERAAKLSILS
jgi:hypothetical protein